MNELNPMLTGPHLARRKQINTLHIFNENVVEVRHDVEYRITFQTSDQKTLVMVILLPPDFPGGSRPLVKIIPANNEATSSSLRHPWLAADNLVVGSPGLNHYGMHSDLGRVVQAIKREFQKNPPTVMNAHSAVEDVNLKNNAKTVQALSNIASTTMFTNNCHPYPSPVANAKSRSIPEIERLTKEQLEEIQKDPLAFNVFCRRLNVSMFSSMDENVSKLKDEIKSLVETNASLSHEMSEKKVALEEKCQALTEAQSQTSSTAKELAEASQKLSLATLCDNLLLASQADEVQSEKCAELFLSGQSTLEDFLTEYVELRARHHARKTNHEKLDKTLHSK